MLMKTRNAFTLMELMVVVLIIGVLLAIVLGVASSVSNTGRRAFTTDTIRVVEMSLEEYNSVIGARPQYYITDPRVNDMGPINPDDVFPIADARDFGGGLIGPNQHQMINSAGLFIQQLKDVSTAYEGIATTLDAEAFKPFSPTPLNGGQVSELRQPLLPTPFDAWGNPIRYVHPTFDGLIYGSDQTDPTSPVDLEDDLRLFPNGQGQNPEWAIAMIRRNAESNGDFADVTGDDRADSDGGVCQGDHPYFYSAGPDGDPSTTEDNVYGSSTPVFQRPQG